MRKILAFPLVLPLAIALTQASALAAAQSPQSAAQAPQSEPALNEIQVRASMPGHQLQPQQIDEVKGAYLLDNGTSFKITSAQRKLFAQLGQGQLTELVAISENRFVSKDQRLTVQYRPMAFNDEIVLTYPSDLSVAGSALVTVRLALN